MTAEIRVALAGVGNCASSLVQGVEFYRQEKTTLGLSNPKIGPFKSTDIEFVAAFDIDKRKVGRDLSEAIFEEPNNTRRIVTPRKLGFKVHMAQPLDGVSQIAGEKIQVSDSKPSDVVSILKESNPDVLVNVIPTGASRASEMYAEAAVEAGCAFVNATPARIASSTKWQAKFTKAKAPVAGDDVMDQIGSTVLHRSVLAFLADRGVRIGETYQLDIGGGTESELSLDKKRYEIKREIKTAAVAAAVPYKFPITAGSSDFVDFMENRRTSYFSIKGSYFAGTDFSLDMRMTLEDGPACAGTLIDVIRMIKVAQDRGEHGPLEVVSAYGFKAPPKRIPEQTLKQQLSLFTKGIKAH